MYCKIKEIQGNILRQTKGHTSPFLCVPTNGELNSKKELIMGAGLALKFKEMWPHLPTVYGQHVLKHGNIPCVYSHNPMVVNTYDCGNRSPVARLNERWMELISFPTKYHWKDKSDLDLIASSAQFLQNSLELWEHWIFVNSNSLYPKFNGFENHDEQVLRASTHPQNQKEIPQQVVPILLTRVGCGLGGLDWHTQVKPIIGSILDDRFWVINP